MNGGGHAEDKIRNSHGLYGKVLGRRDAAPLPAVSFFFGSAADGFWRRVFNLNTSIARKETATERLDWNGFAGMHCLSGLTSQVLLLVLTSRKVLLLPPSIVYLVGCLPLV